MGIYGIVGFGSRVLVAARIANCGQTRVKLACCPRRGVALRFHDSWSAPHRQVFSRMKQAQFPLQRPTSG